MFLTASKKINVLEQQLAAICMALKDLRGDLEIVATARRKSCRTAYYKDVERSRLNQKKCYQRHKGQRSAKAACAHCGTHVRSDYMRRHLRTTKCTAARLRAPSLTGPSDTLLNQHMVPLSLGAP